MCPAKPCTISVNIFCRKTYSLKICRFPTHSACNKHSFLYATSLSGFDYFAIILEMTKLEQTAKIRGGGRITSTFNTEPGGSVLFLELSVKGPHKMRWLVICRQRDSCLRHTVWVVTHSLGCNTQSGL